MKKNFDPAQQKTFKTCLSLGLNGVLVSIQLNKRISELASETTPRKRFNALNFQRILAQWRIFHSSVESNLERYFSILICCVTGLTKSHATF